MIDENINIGFANCCCIKIYFDINWKIKIIFKGYPDENKYIYLEEGNINKYSFGITLNLNDSIIAEYLNRINNKKVCIFIIRHGNSFHNQPIKINNRNLKSFIFRVYDSPLTPLGIYQTKKLKNFLIDNSYLKVDNFNDNIFCASTLNRSQHTSLLLIPNILEFKNLCRLRFYFGFCMIRRLLSNINIKDVLDTMVNFWKKKYKEDIRTELDDIFKKFY